MILFAVLIGPVNLFVLGKMQRRIWLLWTVPAISLFTCLLVFAYMVVAEGWQGRSNIVAITILDEGQRRATTLSRCAFYTPLTPGGGLYFSPETEVTALASDGQGTACTIDWTNGQHFANGWITARIPAQFACRKSETARQRVGFSQGNPAVTLTNGLGEDIRSLWYADADGRLYRSGPVAAGQQGMLEKTEHVVPAVPANSMRKTIYATQDWVASIKAATRDFNKGAPNTILAPNTYLAEVQASPFLNYDGKPEGLRSARPRESSSYVFGILRGARDGR
jgi:hypothetical protein